MNNYIITYEGTDKQYKDVMCGMTANTAREAIIAFYKKYLAPLCCSASNGCIYNLYGEVVQTGDDWIQFGNGRFTAKLADEQPNKTSVEAETPVESPMERLLKDAINGQQMMQDSAHFHHSVYRILAGDKPIQVIESLCESIMAQNEQIKRMVKQSKFGSGLLIPRPHEVNQEVERLKAENDRLKSYKKECQRLQAEVDRLKSCIERQQEQTINGTTGMLKTIQDLYKYSQENDAIVYEKYRKLKDDYDQKVEHLNLLKDENQSYKSIIKALVFAFGLTALGICIYIKTL